MNIQRERRRLSGQAIEGDTYDRVDLRGALAFGSTWIRCSFTNSKFGQARLDDATFVDCSFTGCDLSQATLVSRFRNCTFVHCDFSQAQIVAAHIAGAMFKKCRFQYANFTRATLDHVGLIGCDLHGANLDFAATYDVDFTGTSFWGALIPINCAMFVGNTFDRAQLHRFLGLLLHARGDWLEEIAPLVDPIHGRLIDRLVDEETAEIERDRNPDRPDDGRGRIGALDSEVEEGRGADRAPQAHLVAGRDRERSEATVAGACPPEEN